MESRKMFSKFVAVVMAVCVFVGFSTSATGETRIFGTKEIVINGDVDKEKSQLIIDAINGEGIISPRNILCIFGHSLTRTTVVEINHRYYSTAPRCRRVTYDVTYCTRSGCGYINYTVISTVAIHCC